MAANTAVATTNNNTLSIFSNAESWGLAVKMATSLAQSTIVPKEYQGNANNTLIAIEMSNRLQTSPLMIMQNLFPIYGRPSWSAQYVIAMINGSGKYDMELQYDEKVDKDGKPFSCQCWTEKAGRKVTGPVIDMNMAKAEGWIDKNGSKWKTMPQIMLRYRAASFFGRMNCPELTMGIYTREEVVELGPEEYVVSDVQTEVQQDIAQNANSVPFEPVTIEQKPQPKTLDDIKAGVDKQASAVPAGNSTKAEPEALDAEEMPDFMRG